MLKSWVITQSKISCNYTWLLHAKICPSRWRFHRSFYRQASPVEEQSQQQKEKEKKGRWKKNPKIEKPKDVGRFFVFFVVRKLECTKIHDLSEMVAECYTAPILGCTKRYDPHPICTNPPTLINDRSLNTPHQRHYSSYLVICTFWCGVAKYREAPFSPS